MGKDLTAVSFAQWKWVFRDYLTYFSHFCIQYIPRNGVFSANTVLIKKPTWLIQGLRWTPIIAKWLNIRNLAKLGWRNRWNSVGLLSFVYKDVIWNSMPLILIFSTTFEINYTETFIRDFSCPNAKCKNHISVQKEVL